MGGIAACVRCVVLLSLKCIAVEKRTFVTWSTSLGQLMNMSGAEGAVRNTPGKVLSSTESQEQGVKRAFYLASRIHP